VEEQLIHLKQATLSTPLFLISEASLAGCPLDTVQAEDMRYYTFADENY